MDSEIIFSCLDIRMKIARHLIANTNKSISNRELQLSKLNKHTDMDNIITQFI